MKPLKLILNDPCDYDCLPLKPLRLINILADPYKLVDDFLLSRVGCGNGAVLEPRKLG